MDPTHVEKDTVKESGTAVVHNTGHSRKKKKKKKRKASQSVEVSNNQDIGGEAELSSNYSDQTQESAVKESTRSANNSRDIIEDKPELSVPFSEEQAVCESEERVGEKQEASCDCDTAPVEETSHSTIESTTKKKKRKKKKKKNTSEETNEEKVEQNSEPHVVESNNAAECEPNQDDTLEVQEIDAGNAVDVTSSGILYPVDGETALVEDETRTEGTTKKKKKKSKGAIEKKEEAQTVDFKDPERPESQNKQADSLELVPGDDTVHAVANDGKSTSNSPINSRKKRKKKMTGGFLLSEVSLYELRKPDLDKEKNNGSVAVEKEVTTTEDSDLKHFTEERSLLDPEARERNNLSKVQIITYGLGLETLRRLFMRIHPTWSNKSDDAKHLDKGRMHLQKHELTSFDTGNINDWDVSLITTVLLYSKICAKEINKKGFEDDVRTIKEQKNLLLSHANSERMTDDEFNTAWDKISKSLETIGASTEDIEDVRTDDTLESGKIYRDILLQELANKEKMTQGINDIKAEMKNMPDAVAKEVASYMSSYQSDTKCEDQPGIQGLDGPKFYEWIHFCEKVQNFNHNENNYVLITDAMSPEDLNQFSVLRNVPWKIVIDFDPSSEEKGMYHDFVTNDGQKSLIEMITPVEIRHQYASTNNLALDPLKTQWLFVNGREKDCSASGSAQSVQNKKKSPIKHINGFLRCCSDKLDKHKPLICVILPILKETLDFLQVILERLDENFDEFRLHMVGMKHENIPSDLQNEFDIHLTDLSPDLLSKGLKHLLYTCPGKEYRMPTSQAKLQTTLTNGQYLYLQEYMEVLYDGCEDLPNIDNTEDQEKLNVILSEHRESFFSGNWISFVSLYDNHDARRELGEEVRSHIQRLLDQGPNHQTTVVEINHFPGTGGSTIARRVLWDLHKSYPCAIAKLDNYKPYDIDDDSHFINAFAERICEMREICDTNPLILLDGKHASIEVLRNKLVRELNRRGQRPILLMCLHRSAKTTSEVNKETIPDYRMFQFNVKVKLEHSVADLNQFKEKYKDYIEDLKKKETSSPCSYRVFHFPLLAMLEGFNDKLEEIVHESFDNMKGLEKEVAAVVAFIQHYADQGTPTTLLYKAFKKDVSKSDIGQGISYKEINEQLITEHLLNLMVPTKPTKCQQTTSAKYAKSSNATSATTHEIYTFQHSLVADMVLQRYYTTQKCSILTLTREFLEFPLYQDTEFSLLVNELFIRNRSSRKARNSILFEELKSIDIQEAGKLFCELANKTGNAIVFGNAARFYINKNPPSFKDAQDLMTKAFKCKNAQQKNIIKIINDMNGGILHSRLKFMVENDEIDSISKLEQLADEALRSFKAARTWPLTFPGPLTGEVKVWITCIDWIIKNQCSGDTDKAFEYINSSEAPPFFTACISNSFYLLDIVDYIIENEPTLPEPQETRNLANTLRLGLSVSRASTISKKRKSIPKDNGLMRRCKQLCSTDKFPKCSEAELKRLQVHYLLSSVGQIETMKREDMEFLLNLLEFLVFTDKHGKGRYTVRHLMKLSLHITGPKEYSLDKGLQVAEIMMEEFCYDPLPYFYVMMINFLRILDGNPLEYRDRYYNALEECRKKSQNNCRRVFSTHYLKKKGEGMSRLMTKSDLITEPEYGQKIDSFWTTHSRKKHFECSGRIRTRQSQSDKRKQVYIELVQGNIEVYVPKNAEIGKVKPYYSSGTLVYFVVSFTLEGPVANGITFIPTNS